MHCTCETPGNSDYTIHAFAEQKIHLNTRFIAHDASSGQEAPLLWRQPGNGQEGFNRGDITAVCQVQQGFRKTDHRLGWSICKMIQNICKDITFPNYREQEHQWL